MNKGVALVVLLMVTMTMASTLRKRFNLNKYPELHERNDEVITHHHHHHQSLFIHEIVSFYMVFLGIVLKTRLKY